MSQTDRQEVESIAIRQSAIDTRRHLHISLQDDCRYLSKVCGAVIRPLKHFASTVTPSLQVFQTLDIELIIHKSTGGKL
jgi:hypothetical protein